MPGSEQEKLSSSEVCNFSQNKVQQMQQTGGGLNKIIGNSESEETTTVQGLLKEFQSLFIRFWYVKAKN